MANANREAARLAADEIFEAVKGPDEVSAAIPAGEEERSAFMARLALRAAIDAASEGAPVDVPASVSSHLRQAYARARLQARPEPDLAAPGTWLGALHAFNGDVAFVMKLAGRNVSRPTARFLRHVADVLGASTAAVAAHFEEPDRFAPAGIERKSSGKPSAHKVEDFAAAVREADLPDEFKTRWLAAD